MSFHVQFFCVTVLFLGHLLERFAILMYSGRVTVRWSRATGLCGEATGPLGRGSRALEKGGKGLGQGGRALGQGGAGALAHFRRQCVIPCPIFGCCVSLFGAFIRVIRRFQGIWTGRQGVGAG